MDTRKCLFLLILICLLLPSTSFSTKYAGEFLDLGVGARPQGMGSAYVALTGDATSAYWNAAGCAISSRELFLMHSQGFGGVVKYDCLSYVHPLKYASGRRGLAALVSRVGIEGIKITALRDSSDTSSVYVEKLVNASDYCLQLAYGQEKGPLSVGGSLKMVRRDTGTNTAFGSGVDLGFLYRPREGVSLGANLRDITTTILVWDTGTREYVFPSLRSGAALSTGIRLIPGQLNLALDLETRFENQKSASQFSMELLSADLHLGAEYWYRNVFALRAGSDLGHFTMGCGISYKKYGFDYAFLSHDDLGGSHRISGSFMFQ